jgi:hypothetical protein
MDAIFNSEEVTTAGVVVAADEKATNDAKKEKSRIMKAALKETIQSDPTYKETLRRLSDSVRVVNTLGYGSKGNVVVDKTKQDRTLKEIAKIVGYAIENTGSEAISYTTEEFVKNEAGIYVGTVVDKTLTPGEVAYLTRKYMTVFCSKPEISFTLTNGKIVASSRKGSKTIDDELESFFFQFNKEEDGTHLEVNDDTVKLSIDEEGVIKEEYESTFGYLANPKAPKAPKDNTGKDFTTQDLCANYIQSLIKNQTM